MSRQKRNGEEDNEIGWGGIFGALATGAAIGGGMFLLAKALSDEEKPETQRRNSPSSIFQSVSQVVESYSSHISSSSGGSRKITLAVDATDSTCAGLIIFPMEKEIYFYSDDWDPYFSFNGQPDKFEMINALVGLETFHHLIMERSYTELVIKTDNNFFLSTYNKDAEDKNLLAYIEGFKDDLDLKTEWSQVTRSDKDLYLADNLSRRPFWTKSKIEESYPDYDVAEMEVEPTLKKITRFVPKKYHKYQHY